MGIAARIGIVSNFDPERRVYFCRPAYVRAVEAAGGLPVLLPYLTSQELVLKILDTLDGLLLSGGSDLDPGLYGEAMHPAIRSVIPQRDAFELTLASAALNGDVPTLGICRGVQSLNVAAGGSLYPDLPSRLPGALNHWDPAHLNQPVHPVRIEADSRLASLCGTTTVRVNSWHHQAVKDVAKDFRACAYTPDGVIEAIESTGHRFIVGVQWHPEDLWETEPACRRLFTEFVACCARTSTG